MQKNKILLYFIIMLGIIGLSSYPSSNAKYYKGKNDYLKYNSTLVALADNREETQNMSANQSADYSTINYSFSFPRNLTASNANDTYSLIVTSNSKYCQTYINNHKGQTITINKNSATSDEIDVLISCAVEKKGNYVVKATITESVDGTTPFQYQTFSGSYYVRNIPTNNDKFITLSSALTNEARQKAFYDWVVAKTQYQAYKEDIALYLNSNETLSSLSGVVVDNQNYSVDDTFLNSALNYALNTKFDTYLQTKYQSDLSNYYFVTNYVRSNMLTNNLTSLIDTTIPGLTYNSFDNSLSVLDEFDFTCDLITPNNFKLYAKEHAFALFLASLTKMDEEAATILLSEEKAELLNNIKEALESDTTTPSYFILDKSNQIYLLLEITSTPDYKEVHLLNATASFENESLVSLTINYDENSLFTKDQLKPILDAYFTSDLNMEDNEETKTITLTINSSTPETPEIPENSEEPENPTPDSEVNPPLDETPSDNPTPEEEVEPTIPPVEPEEETNENQDTPVLEETTPEAPVGETTPDSSPSQVPSSLELSQDNAVSTPTIVFDSEVLA